MIEENYLIKKIITSLTYKKNKVQITIPYKDNNCDLWVFNRKKITLNNINLDAINFFWWIK